MVIKQDITIVGGGIAGLYFALRAVRSPHPPQIRILEASNRLGGLIHTIYDRDGLQYEAGAGRFNKYHKKLIALLKHYKLTIKTIAHTSKTFRPLFRPVPSADFAKDLQFVLAYSARLTTTVLQQMTFEELCVRVIGSEKTRALIASFGYNAEFQIANAHTSLALFREDFNTTTSYHVCVEGLSELVARIEADLVSKGVVIEKGTCVKAIRGGDRGGYHRGYQLILKDGTTLKTDRLVLAIPKSALLAFDWFSAPQKSLFESVEGVNLHRIYAKYASAVPPIGRTTTDLHLRQVIPINSENGLVMVSYSDTSDADFWKAKRARPAGLKAEIERQLGLVFPEIVFPQMEWLRSYFWKTAVHCWRAGVNPTKTRKAIERIHPNLHIIGESYSMRQGWIEGALESANRAVQNYNKDIKTQKQK